MSLRVEWQSNYLEGLNATRNLRRAIGRGYLDIIEVLDNSAFVSVSRRGRAKDPLSFFRFFFSFFWDPRSTLLETRSRGMGVCHSL